LWRLNTLSDQIDIPDCQLIDLAVNQDPRGTFLKTFTQDIFKNLKIEFSVYETYITISKKNVLRGLHYQSPPDDHDKIVCCLQGEVLDVFVDLRASLPSYGLVNSIKLNSQYPQMLFLPKGIAHGFLALSDNCQMQYFVNSAYSPKHDHGIKWDSIRFNWNIDNPVLSERDKSFIDFEQFESPFK
jgi:dTDP-4-dehydrorhamnose 3,5-epimerase